MYLGTRGVVISTLAGRLRHDGQLFSIEMVQGTGLAFHDLQGYPPIHPTLIDAECPVALKSAARIRVQRAFFGASQPDCNLRQALDEEKKKNLGIG